MKPFTLQTTLLETTRPGFQLPPRVVKPPSLLPHATNALRDAAPDSSRDITCKKCKQCKGCRLSSRFFNTDGVPQNQPLTTVL